MRDGARIETVIEILERMKGSKIPMDNNIRDYLHHKRYIGSKDRKAIVELVYDVVRAHARLGWWLDKVNFSDSPRSRVIAYLALDGMSAHNIAIRFSAEQYCPDELNEAEQKAVKKLEGKALTHDDMAVAVQCECPPELEEKLTKLFGDEFEAQLKAMLEPAGLDLRVNTIKIDVEKAQNSLKKDEVETVRTTYSPVGLRCIGKPYMRVRRKRFIKALLKFKMRDRNLSHIYVVLNQVCG